MWFSRYPGPVGNLGFPIFPKSTEIDSANFGSHNLALERGGGGTEINLTLSHNARSNMSADDLNSQQTRDGNNADDNVENTLAVNVTASNVSTAVFEEV